jgi:hypothetical protein
VRAISFGVTDPAERALARLRDPSWSMLARGVEIAIESALAMPARDVIDPAGAVAMVAGSVDEERVARALSTVVRPAVGRQRAVLGKRGDTVGAYFPEGTAALLEEIAAGAKPPKGAWARKIVDPSHVRELLAPVLQETLLAFARKLPLVGAVEEGRAGKILGGLARGLAQGAGEKAQKLVDLGRGALGGLGAEMEKRIATAAREFSQGAMEPLRDAFAERLASEEGREILARMRAHAVSVVLAAPVGDVIGDLDGAPQAAVDRLIARTIAHDVARPEVQQMLRAEIEAFLAQREGATVGALLDEWSVRDETVREWKRIGNAVAKKTVESEAFAGWLRDLFGP